MAPKKFIKKTSQVVWTPPYPKEESGDLFNKLPAEIRNRIYRLVLKDEVTISSKNGWDGPALLRAGEGIQSEMMGLFFTECKFVVIIDGNLKELLEPFCAAIRRYNGINQAMPLRFAKPLEIHFRGKGFWEGLEDLLPLLELMRETGYEPATQEYVPAAVIPGVGRTQAIFPESLTSVVRMPRSSMRNAQYVVEKALALARLARKEGWTEGDLAGRFAAFSAEQTKLKGRKKPITSGDFVL